MAQSSSQLAGTVREGDVLAGKYRVGEVIGAGGMGVVVAAHHLQLDERVAIKFLLPEVLGNAEAVARFAREARAAVKIKSEHVARVTDVGSLENGSPYMVMEYLDGGDLGAIIQRQGPLSVEQALEFILQTGEAIAEAHSLGIIHRDLKPSNLFCIRRSDGLLSVKVLDFGISKVTGLGGATLDARMTGTTSVFGSPMYMSPEQMLSAHDVDARTDIWALGVVLYELLAGGAPFEGDTLPELIAKISTQPPPPMRSRRPNTPEGVEAVILKCLQKDRNHRYLNVAEFAIALAPHAPKRARASVERISRVIQNAGLSSSALVWPPSSIPPSQLPAADTMAPLGHTTPGLHRKPVVVAVAALVLLVAVGAAGIVLRLLRSGVPTAALPTTAAASVQPASAAPANATTAPAMVPVEVSDASRLVPAVALSAPIPVVPANPVTLPARKITPAKPSAEPRPAPVSTPATTPHPAVPTSAITPHQAAKSAPVPANTATNKWGGRL